jgi:hypothetical protein
MAASRTTRIASRGLQEPSLLLQDHQKRRVLSVKVPMNAENKAFSTLSAENISAEYVLT